MKNIHRAKFILIGLMIGLMASSFFAYADEIQQFILTKVNYPIIVNNQEYTNSELPVLNYEGNTYVPLKAVGDLLTVKIKWNNELERVEIVQQPKINTVTTDEIIANTKYVNLSYINENYGDKGFLIKYNRDTKEIFLILKENEKVIFEFPHDKIIIVNGKTCVTQEYFNDIILPLLNK